MSFNISAGDALANVAGYIPIGLVFSELGLGRTVAVAVGMSTLAETSQIAMRHRSPSAVDIGTNAIGALLGVLVSRRWNLRLSTLRVNRWNASIAAASAGALLGGVWAVSGYAPNARGSTSPGTLEAHWTLDELDGNVAHDSSANGLDGTFKRPPSHVEGVLGGAARFDGSEDYIDFGRSTPLRLVGSMTVSAWINATAFPVDDAAIVSNHNALGQGYQLDTTVDKGPRTIGFKLANECGNLMARYGATPLVVGTWYHIAGVYSARARTLDVFLNGKLDNGFLLGFVTGTQRSSRESVYVGRRSSAKGFEFAGSIDDVRIYSRALTESEIAAEMHGTGIEDGAKAAIASEDGVDRAAPTSLQAVSSPCAVQSDREDMHVPGAAAALGVLVAIAMTGLWPAAAWPLYVAAALAAGLLMLREAAWTMPLLGLCSIPLMSLAGAASVVASRSRDANRDAHV